MGSQENHSRGGIVEDERAAARSDQNEETVPLVSAEQDLKRTKRHQGVQVSKGKMYTLLGTILVLFGLLVANTFTDWQAFRGVLQVERENVDVTGLVPEEVVRPLQLVNAEQAQADFEVDEQIAIEEVLSQSHSANVVLGKEEKQKKKKDKKKKAETKTEAAPEVAVGGGSDNEVDGIRAQIQAVKKRMAENKGASGEARRQNEVDRREVEALERRLRKATGSTDKYDPEREKQRREKYKRLEKRREEAKVARKISLDPEVERIVNSFDGDLRPPEYCFTSPKGNPARPKQDAASGGGGGAKGRGLLRRRRKRNKNRPSTGGGRVPPDWAVLPLNASQAILRVAAEKYPCLILHKDCFDTSYYSGAKKLRQWYEKAYFAKSKLTWEERLEKLEDFSKLRLGTCAVVGNADNTIKGKFGKEIDEHDFVIRYNVITKPFEEAIGKKTDGLFDKMNYLGTEFAPDTTPTTFNLFPKVGNSREKVIEFFSVAMRVLTSPRPSTHHLAINHIETRLDTV